MDHGHEESSSDQEPDRHRREESDAEDPYADMPELVGYEPALHELFVQSRVPWKHGPRQERLPKLENAQ